LDFFGLGQGAFIGTVGGFAAAWFCHWLFPQLDDFPIVYAGLVVAGFVIGLIVDARSEIRR
jgi:hypothetical protein